MTFPNVLLFLPLGNSDKVPLAAPLPYSFDLPADELDERIAWRQRNVCVVYAFVDSLSVVRVQHMSTLPAYTLQDRLTDRHWADVVLGDQIGVSGVLFSPHAKSLARLRLKHHARTVPHAPRVCDVDQIRDPVQDWCEPAVLSLESRKMFSTWHLLSAVPNLGRDLTPGLTSSDVVSVAETTCIWLRACALLLGTDLWPQLP